MNLIRLLLHHAKTQPDAPALVDSDRTLTYRELMQYVAQTAGHLIKLGVRDGDRVGICVKDGWDYVVVMLAVGYAGAVIVPMDWRARDKENARIVEFLTIKLIVVEPGVAVPAQCPAVTIDPAWRRAVDLAVPFDAPYGSWDAPLILAPTSGTTGMPKFSVATHLQIYFRSTLPIARPTPRDRPNRFLSALPLCFAGGYQRLFTQLLAGDCVVLHPALFTAAEYVAALVRHDITLAYVVPMMARQLLQLAGTGARLLPDGVSLLAGGAPLFAEEKQEIAHRLTANFFEIYASSAIGGVSCLWPADIAVRPESVGRIFPLIEAEVVDDEDRTVGPNAVGRLRLRGPGLGSSLGLPDEHAAGSGDIRDGWHYPGDFGALDELGYLFIRGRTSDVIMRGGAKIHPGEIEAVLLEHSEVAEAAVVGARAAGNEEYITAFVVARGPLESGDLLAHCRARLTPYKVPQVIRLVPSLPRNSAGKVSKTALADLLDQPFK